MMFSELLKPLELSVFRSHLDHNFWVLWNGIKKWQISNINHAKNDELVEDFTSWLSVSVHV